LLNHVVIFGVEICRSGGSRVVRTICFLRAIALRQTCEPEAKLHLTAAQKKTIATLVSPSVAIVVERVFYNN
jgi:hypothetical protein